MIDEGLSFSELYSDKRITEVTLNQTKTRLNNIKEIIESKQDFIKKGKIFENKLREELESLKM
jgi:hypothetical protein